MNAFDLFKIKFFKEIEKYFRISTDRAIWMVEHQTKAVFQANL